MGFYPGHDGAVAVLKDRTLLFNLEAEKDSYQRHDKLSLLRILEVMERIGEVPDVIALGGQQKDEWWFSGGNAQIGVGYFGSKPMSRREGTFCGKPTTFFSSSHVRSHIMMGAGMAPEDDVPLRAALVWEGGDGSFYLLNEKWEVVRDIPVLMNPGMRYALPYAIANPKDADFMLTGAASTPGKLMALAAYGDPAAAGPGVRATVDQILGPLPLGKQKYRNSPLYNAGPESEVTKTAAALLQSRLFDMFARVALKEIPAGIPLYISGGCGLNCDWNTMWRELGHFSSVFVPPCANDSGSALGTAIDALYAITGDPRISWDVYCGLEFEHDHDPDPETWNERPMEEPALADAIAGGRVVAWVQGRYEMGPRALGNRSLLASPFDRHTREHLNEVKQREHYRPIAPICRIEDAGKVFDTDFHDPHMLYFRRVKVPYLEAVTHVDGSARAQTVTKEGNKPLHDLLSAFAERHGVGVLCNTSLNYKGLGFINKMADLAHYCEERGIDDFVVGDRWFQRARMRVVWEQGPVPSRFVRQVIEQDVPEGTTVLVMAEGLDEMLQVEGRDAWHFPRNDDGTYQGEHPADSAEAVALLEAQRDNGAAYLAIPSSQQWWLYEYPAFRGYLEERCHTVRSDDGCLIFALDEAVPKI